MLIVGIKSERIWDEGAASACDDEAAANADDQCWDNGK